MTTAVIPISFDIFSDHDKEMTARCKGQTSVSVGKPNNLVTAQVWQHAS